MLSGGHIGFLLECRFPVEHHPNADAGDRGIQEGTPISAVAFVDCGDIADVVDLVACDRRCDFEFHCIGLV